MTGASVEGGAFFFQEGKIDHALCMQQVTALRTTTAAQGAQIQIGSITYQNSQGALQRWHKNNDRRKKNTNIYKGTDPATT